MLEKNVEHTYKINIYLMSILLIGSVAAAIICLVPGNAKQIINVIIYLAIMALSLTLAFTRRDSHDAGGTAGIWLYRVITILFYATAFLLFGELLPKQSGYMTLMKISYSVTLIMTTGAIFMFFMFLLECAEFRRKNLLLTIFGIITIAEVLLVLINLFVPVVFTVDESLNVLYMEPAIHSYIEMACLVFTMILVLVSNLVWKEKVVWLLYSLSYIIGYELAVFSEKLELGGIIDSIHTLCGSIAIVILFCNVYMRRNKEFSDKQKLLMQSQLTTMQMQINPHFIYNTLGSIGALYHSDPEEAEELLHKFADYLRANHAHVHEQTMIPFEDELKRMEHYMAIEQVRFPDIEMEYDFEVTDFMIPISTIQPLVENAVLHGICVKMDRVGLITIRTKERDGYYIVQIEDDGVGFDKIPEDGKRQHIGMKNVKTRLELICGGSLDIHSQLGKGTICEIRIPKEAQKNEGIMRR